MELEQESQQGVLMRFDKRTLEAILALRTDANFQLFVEAIARETEQRMKTLITVDLPHDDLLRLQGMTRMGTVLLEAIGTADTVYQSHLEPRS